jgi:hypothetical protein
MNSRPGNPLPLSTSIDPLVGAILLRGRCDSRQGSAAVPQRGASRVTYMEGTALTGLKKVGCFLKYE